MGSSLETENSVLVCDYANLSNQFDVKFIINHDKTKTGDVVDFSLNIKDKSGKEITNIIVHPKIASSDISKFTNCDYIKSLSTKHNLSKNFNMDLYDGNIVVGDFNFDGLDDIAVYNRKDISQNKFYYDYYLRKEGGNYIKNEFLSNQTDYFGKKYDLNNKTIVVDNDEFIRKYSFQNGEFIKTAEEIVEKVTVKQKNEPNIKYPKNTGYQTNYNTSLSTNQQSKMDYFIDDFYGHVETRDGIVMNVREYADKNSRLITQLQPHTKYVFTFNGQRNGQWAYVSNIQEANKYSGSFYNLPYRGWIKIESDNGNLNFKLVKR